MRKNTRRLQLKRETVRELDQALLGEAQGGVPTTTVGETDPTYTCVNCPPTF